MPGPGVGRVITIDPGLQCAAFAQWDLMTPTGFRRPVWRLNGVSFIRPDDPTKGAGSEDVVDRIGRSLAPEALPFAGLGIEWWVEMPKRGGIYARTERAGKTVATMASLYRQHLWTGALCLLGWQKGAAVRLVPALEVPYARKHALLAPKLAKMGVPVPNEHGIDAVALGHFHLLPMHPELA